MGFYGKLEEKQEVIRLRKKGYSYSEILDRVKISKNSVSRWCRDIGISDEHKKRLEGKKILAGEKGREIAARNKKERRLSKIKLIRLKSKKDIGNLSRRDKFIVGLGLYIGDGLKGDSEVGFSNSNPKIIKFMSEWFREYCRVDENKMRGQIWIHEGLDIEVAQKYWSKITNIPKKQFRKTYISKNKIYSKKIRKNIHKHGVFAIKISDVDLQRKIMGWMSGILD